MEFNENEWLIRVREEASLNRLFAQRESYDSTTHCIFRIPSTLLKENEAAYFPEVVSFGPYHFGKPQLSGMEKYKDEAVRRIQRRFPVNFTGVVTNLMSMEHKIRACYDRKINFSNDVLCWMMARDASFLVEFFMNYIRPFENRISQDYTLGDEDFHPVFNTKEGDDSLVSMIVKDVIKLENQIPLFVLEQFLANELLDEVIKIVLANIYRPFPYVFLRSLRTNHMLEMYQHSCLGKVYFGRNENGSDLEPLDDRTRLPSASKLKVAGVKFKADAVFMDSVSFDKKESVLCLPFIILNVESEVFIRNLIALELRSPPYKPKIFTQYAQFMDDLIHNEEDAALMRKHGVFGGNLRTYERFASLWSSSNLMPSISQSASIVRTRTRLHYLYDNKWKTSYKIIRHEFCKDYGYKPWLVFGGFGALIVLVLTGIQVFCLFHHCS